jgi:hypothetical protein
MFKELVECPIYIFVDHEGLTKLKSFEFLRQVREKSYSEKVLSIVRSMSYSLVKFYKYTIS